MPVASVQWRDNGSGIRFASTGLWEGTVFWGCRIDFGVWFLLEGHFATCESGRRGSHEETAQSIHFLGLPSSGLCWGVTMEVRDGPMPRGGVVRSKHGDDLSRAMIAREDSQGVLDDVDT